MDMNLESKSLLNSLEKHSYKEEEKYDNIPINKFYSP